MERILSLTDALDSESLSEIRRILHDGNTVELKLERGQLVIVEIKRRARIKKSLQSGRGE